jgi:uncharacterized membrane protein YwzB
LLVNQDKELIAHILILQLDVVYWEEMESITLDVMFKKQFVVFAPKGQLLPKWLRMDAAKF